MESERLTSIRSGNKRTLAKAITLLESSLDKHKEESKDLVGEALMHSGKSFRIGITGVPGVGKSTFIESLGLYLLNSGFKVAVLAVDPSSPLTGGSILGDKTRMEMLSREENAFIRPSPTSGSLGGVAQKTRETILLCEAAGYDIVLIETVGVGQSEYNVSEMVDFFLVMMLPGGGDELQGLKKGILELADGMIVNKCDGDSIQSAKVSKQQYTSALSLISKSEYWNTPVLTCSAFNRKDVIQVWKMIGEFFDLARGSGELENRRNKQNVDWMNALIKEVLIGRIYSNSRVNTLLLKLERCVKKMEMTPYAAAREVIKTLDLS